MARRRPEPTVNPARGIALVVVAVLLGLVLLRNGIDTSEVVTSTKGDDKAADEQPSDDETDSTEAPVDTEPPVKEPAEVSVIVLNGTSVGGAAGKYTTAIGTAGYQMLEADDAPTKVATTQVFFTEGFDREAAAVAAAAGAPQIVPQPLPTPPPGEVGAANVVVVIGTDIANLTPTTAAAADTTETSAA